MEFFEKPSRAELDAAFPYKNLTVTGRVGDALWHPLYRLRLAADDDAKEDNKLVARDLTRARREVTALAVVDAWNKDRTRPVPVFSVREGDGSRRCAFVAIEDGRAASRFRAEDCSTLEPLADAVAAAGGRLVVVQKQHRADVDDLDLLLVSPHVDVDSLGKTSTASTSLKVNGVIVYGNGRNSFWAAFAENDDNDDAKDEAPSVARPRRARRSAAAAPVAPPKPVKSPEEIADLPCFVRDALERGRPVLDDDAESFRAHYSCLERTRTDPEDTRIIRIKNVSTGKTARQYFGEFYPTSGFGKWNPGFSPKDPPAGSYVA